jgi:hypothetical protein
MITARFKSVVITLMLIVGLAAPLAPAFAATDIFGDACKGAAADSAVCRQASEQNKSQKNPVINAIRIIANGFALVAGVAAVIMIIIGGLTLVTSAGNTENVAKARRRIIYSIIGLVVIALAWAVVRLITDRVIQ